MKILLSVLTTFAAVALLVPGLSVVSRATSPNGPTICVVLPFLPICKAGH